MKIPLTSKDKKCIGNSSDGEEKEIARAAIQAEQKQSKKSEKMLLSAVSFLIDKQMSIEKIAQILNITPEEITQIQKKSDIT